MDLGRAFGYVTEDERWLTKMLVGGLVALLGSFILVGPIILLGYTIETARNIVRGHSRPLPEWGNWGYLLGEGFKAIVVGIVYSLPVLLIACVMGGIVGTIAGSATEDTAGAITGLVLCLYGIIFLLGLLTAPFSMAGFVRYIQTGDIATSVRFGDTLTMVRRTPGSWIMLVLVQILCQFVGQLGAILCGVGLLLSLPYSQAVFAHVLAQAVTQNGGLSGNFSGSSGYAPPPSYTPPTY